MSFEDLLDLSVDDWERLSDEELEKILKPFFLVTRPTKKQVEDAAKGSGVVNKKSGGGKTHAALQNELFTLATQMGIKLPGKP